MSASAASELFPGMEVIDVHAHLGRFGAPGASGDLDEFRRMVDRSGFSKVIISSFLAIAYDAPEGNAEVARAVESDERLYGSVVFNARFEDESRAEIERYADHPRFVSAKTHSYASGLAINSPENLRVIELLAARKLPLTFHSWTGDGERAAEVARRFPELPVFWFHSLAADYPKAAELARELPNVYLEFVTSTQERGKLETLVARLGADRLVFGTDQALFEPIRPLGLVAEAGISDQDRRKILGLTARKVFRGLRAV
jgi:predicted TIM-barrel fold metal-dependent hydrolase